jgi:alkylation response protein AidB-like acyl-CoA dehydrogenase
MPIDLTQEQQMLKSSAREALARECPATLVREMEKDARGYPLPLWRKMAELGWLGVTLPARYGGAGGAFADMAVVLEEMGRVLVPGPYIQTVAMCGHAIAAHGSEAQRQKYLPAIAKGESTFALALLEANAKFTPDAVTLEASRSGHTYFLRGTKVFVPYAVSADHLLVAARTHASAGPAEGVSLFIVDRKSSGLAFTPLATIGSDSQCQVAFDGVAASELLGSLHGGWTIVQEILLHGAVARCAEMVGGGQRVLEMAVEYAKIRVQFGRAIGSFQAVQHHCANMALDLEAARLAAWEAAQKISRGEPFAAEASIAKAWVSEAYRRICATSHQVLGGIGFMEEHDMQLYFRRAKAAELFAGDGYHHRELLLQELGL